MAMAGYVYPNLFISNLVLKHVYVGLMGIALQIHSLVHIPCNQRMSIALIMYAIPAIALVHPRAHNPS